MPSKRQLRLFGTPPINLRARVRPAKPDEATAALAKRLPASLRLGATGWTTPGWDSWVWEQAMSPGILAREGLGAYAQHPLLRTVLLDGALRVARSAEALARLAASTPPDFRFVVGTDPSLLWGRFPDRWRTDDADNPEFLDSEAMIERCVEPFVEGLGDRAGALLIRVPSQDPRALGTRRAFPERLRRFLAALPRGPRYAVELRDHKLLTPEYAAALEDCGVAHCVSLHPSMPSVEVQLEVTRALRADSLLAIWSMCVHFDYRAATRNYAPYDAIVERDPPARAALQALIAAAADKPTLVLVDDMAEGCAPASISERGRALPTSGRRWKRR